jgi:MFS family permease
MSAVTPPPPGPAASGAAPDPGERYKWIALSNTTLGVLIVTINQSILLISLPDIFRGIGLDPLLPTNTSYLLWMLMGFLLVTACLVVSFGRVGDMYGRVRMYNLGFAVFSVASILLSITWLQGASGALWIIGIRVVQGIGGALLMANSGAILTDAFPSHERGKAMGINGVAAITGSFLGLILGGVLAPVEWRLVFLVSVPFGVFGTVWAYLKLKDNGIRHQASIDWAGNITFAVGLIALLAGMVYAIQPYGHHTMGWTNPYVLAAIFGGMALLGVFAWIEFRVPEPMFRMSLFRIRAFSAGNVAALLGTMGRGGLQFVLIIWLQGIWLPLHGYNFEQTPLWAGIYMVPLTIGFLVAGPVSGILSDRYGSRPFATAGLLVSGAAFLLLNTLPMDFSYPAFAALIVLWAFGAGMFISPNQAGVMNSLPGDQRGAGAGMLMTFQNSASVLSIGVFFTVIAIGLSGSLPGHLFQGLVAQGVPRTTAHDISVLPPIGILFAAFLGDNPIQLNLAHYQVLGSLPHAQAAYLTGRQFFPRLISAPFADGLHLAMYFAAATSLVAAVASLLRGGRYVHQSAPVGEEIAEGLAHEAAIDGVASEVSR